MNAAFRNVLCAAALLTTTSALSAAETIPQTFISGGVSVDLSLCGSETAKATALSAVDGVSVALVPLSRVDNTFCLASGQPGIMLFAFKNEKGRKVEAPFVCLKLPPGTKSLAASAPSKVSDTRAEPDGGSVTRIDVGGLKDSFSKDGYGTWNSLGVLVTATAPASDTILEASYWYEDTIGKTEPLRLAIKIVSPAKGKKPKTFETGTMFAREGDFEGESAKIFADFYAGCGFNAVHGNGQSAFYRMAKERGIFRYVQPFWLCNGYRIGQGKKPDGTKFIKADGAPFEDAGLDSICPLEVYKEGEHYRGKIVGDLRKMLGDNDTADSIMPNWEPYYYDFKGCFCEKCRDEFASFAKLPKEEVAASWPSSVMTTHREIWVKFRSWQHGRLMETLEKSISAIGKETGKNAHFIPEIAWSALVEGGDVEFAQYSPADYLGKLPVLEPWGPYIFHPASKKYEYYTGIHMITFAAARDMKRLVASKVPEPKLRPKMIAFPHGLQCDDWVTEPEAIAFDTLCFFLNGWEGSLVYYFPRGYDARYWSALADANTAIAEFEDFTLKGKAFDGISVKPQSPLPTLNIPDYWDEGGDFKKKLPWLKENPALLQAVGYELDGRRLVAVGNFWTKGEAFFILALAGLPEGAYTLREPLRNRQFTAEDGKAFTASDLAKGVPLHVGALRWAFFVIEPGDKSASIPTASITPQTVAKAMTEKNAAIAKAMDYEKEYAARLKNRIAEAVRVPDYSAVKADKDGALSCFLQKAGGVPDAKVVVSGPEAIVTIDPVAGAKIASWIVGGKELVSQEKDVGLGVDAFWWPVKAATRITAPYEFAVQSKDAGSLTFTFKRTLTDKDNHVLAGLTIVKTITVSAEGKNVELSTEIKNTTGNEVEFSFRYHNLCAYLQTVDGKNGTAVFQSEGKPFLFERLFMIRLFRCQVPADKDLEGAFKMDNIGIISSPEVLFESKAFPFKLSETIVNKDDLHCYVLWDGGKQLCATFEPVFKKVKLAPGASWSARSAWKVVK